MAKSLHKTNEDTLAAPFRYFQMGLSWFYALEGSAAVHMYTDDFYCVCLCLYHLHFIDPGSMSSHRRNDGANFLAHWQKPLRRRSKLLRCVLIFMRKATEKLWVVIRNTGWTLRALGFMEDIVLVIEWFGICIEKKSKSSWSRSRYFSSAS